MISRISSFSGSGDRFRGRLKKPNRFPIPTSTPTTQNNLILYYDPSNPASYTGSGTTITDLSGNGRNGIMSNISFISPYFTYNGSSSQISVTDNGLLEPGSGEWTIEVWFYKTSTVGSSVILGKFNNGGGSDDVSYSIRTYGTDVYAQIGDGTGGVINVNYVNSTSYTFSANTWYHAVYVWKPGVGLETFINGTSIGTISTSMNSILNSTNPLYIGRYNGGEFTQNFGGRIGITRLYNTALTSSDVLGSYNNDITKYTEPTPTPTLTPTLTPTPTPTSTSVIVGDLIREQLTTSQKVTYDSTPVGNWIKVTSTQYNNIFNNIIGATKKGNSDTQVNTRESLTSYSNRSITFGDNDTPSFQINTGEYVIAMITETWNQPNATSQLGYTTSFKGNQITNFGNAAGPSTGGTRDYFIRKAPTDIATETRYPTLYMTQSPNGVSSWPGYNTTNGGVTWTSNGGIPSPKIQIITTSTKSW